MDYSELESTLIRAECNFDAAECHGVAAGLVCARGALAGDMLVAMAFDKPDPGNLLFREATGLLGKLCRELHQQLAGEEMDFYPLLPDEGSELSLRLQMLGEWCQGFLVGLHQGGVRDFTGLPGDAREIVDDIKEIARADMYALEQDEEDERALTEIVEFLHASVMLMYDELQPAIPDHDDTPGGRLH